MVGVKGGSKGCLTCRQKRVSCDQAQPACTRCTKAGVQCGGYGRKIRFVHENQRVERAVQRAALRDGGGTGVSVVGSNATEAEDDPAGDDAAVDAGLPVNSSSGGDEAARNFDSGSLPGEGRETTSKPATTVTNTKTLTLHHALTTPGSPQRTHSTSPPSFLSLTPFAPTIHLSHLLTHLLLSPKYNNYQGWLNLHLQSRALPAHLSSSAAHKRDTLSAALSCLSTAYFGLMHGAPELVRKAKKAYGHALVGLRLDLEDPGKWPRFETLASASVLGLYEMVVATTRSGYDKHAMGLAHLVERRGVTRFCSGAAQAWFHENRCLLAAVFIRARKACFLEGRAWKETPWASCPERKTHSQCLGDYMSDIPRLLEDLDGLKARDPVRAANPECPEHRDLLHRVVRLLTLLDAWWIIWTRDATASGISLVGTSSDSCVAFPTPPSTRSPSETAGSPPVFDTVLYYTQAHLGNETCMYAASRICLLHIAESLYPTPALARRALRAAGPAYWASPAFLASTTQGELPGASLDTHHLARVICRSVEFHLLGAWGSVGALYLLFPASVALVWGLERGGREQRWLEGVMGIAAHRKGLKLAGELEGRAVEFGVGGVV